ncbi:SRPBCC family protein [Mycobacterium sp. 236(2023)]|uniref:SRPBCC family protein n=1 Tax=Mycobacterium sp. 236(2023) TaxID=3038163 RepID=UPI00241523C3|nr:SRPBCC family protein [Mycobacterium sp. 236(2023)]MDG4666071.1 SRPBCC family protein [Mycobacterium sp. 236(2023)]
MARTDTVSRVIDASRERVFEALVDPTALAAWLPPEGMTGRFEHVDVRPGGSYRMTLTYDDPPSDGGKSSSDTDIVEGRFTDIVSGERVVQEADFTSDDPAFAGTMTMTWTVTDAGDGTRVEIRADDVPEGISATDHAAGMNSSLDNLARFLAQQRP